MKVGICSLGCKVNIYESELVTNILKNNNVTIDLVDFVDNVADNINLLINEEIKLNEQNKKLAYNA